MTTDDRLRAIIKAGLAGEPCDLPELTRETGDGDVADQRAREARAASLADICRQVGEAIRAARRETA